jgi:hypothetical protein
VREIGEVFGKLRRREVRPTAELRSDGVAGPSREVSKRDHMVSGADRAGQDDEELRWAKRNVPEEPVQRRTRSVFRKTELHGTAPASTPDECRKVRRRTMQNLKAPDGVVAYIPFEAAFRDFICSLMERQDRKAEEMFLHYADLQQRLDALEERLEKDRVAPAAEPEAGP